MRGPWREVGGDSIQHRCGRVDPQAELQSQHVEVGAASDGPKGEEHTERS